MARALSWKPGDRYNDLEFIAVDPDNNKYGIFLCHACGLQKSMSRDGVKRGRYKSCGCMKSALISAVNTKHGQASDFYQDAGRTYHSWDAIPEADRCPEWASYEAFLEDMGERPEGFDLARYDLGYPFAKDNCTWASQADVTANRGRYRNNTSGFKGVSWHNKEQVWMAEVCRNYVRRTKRFPGTRAGLIEAVQWTRKLREQLHGDFANHGDDQ